MEQAYELLSIGVPSRDIRSLVAIAVKAGKRQIVGRRLSAVLASANVIDLKRKSVLRVRNTANIRIFSRLVPKQGEQEMDSRTGSYRRLTL